MVMIVGNFDQNLPKLVGMVDNAAKAVPQKMAAGPVIQEAKSAPAKAVPQKMAAGPVIQEAKSAPAKAVPQKMAAGPVIREAAKSAPAKPMRGFSTLRYSALPRKAGGPVPASKRADGIAQRGKTRGKMR
jgi:hypothetical protein